jgi:hypothetical protein
MILSQIIICTALFIIIAAWRARNIKGRFKSTEFIPRGHSIFYFNPYALYIREQAKQEVVKGIDHTLKNDRVQVKKNEVAIVALNEKNAIRKARKLLIYGGYEPEEAKTINIQST